MSLLMSAANTTLSVFASPSVNDPSAVILPVACKSPLINTSLLIITLSEFVAVSNINPPTLVVIVLPLILTLSISNNPPLRLVA